MFNKFILKDEKAKLAEYFNRRTQDYWKKKLPKDKGYNFIVHDPYEIFGEDSGYEKLYLVGENWLSGHEKPIVIAIGFNDWKFGFIADYLSDFRVAFAPRKLIDYKTINVIRHLSIQPSIVAIWGYNESKALNRYLKYKKFEIWRIEDGFIRSADLGASGATPYSLVIDKSGLYYNPKESSDIENILNTFNFCSSKILENQSKELLSLVIESKVSKYNPPVIFKEKSLNLKKSILVIGQVDNDASIRYGNPNKWTMEDMVRLAKYENPKAEIFYRPHPEIYRGFQDSNFKNINVDSFTKILSPDEHIIDLIERVDHVYTITSLTGLEALIRGKKVTVLGKPFYAGWGLTDDRVIFEDSQRVRKLKLWELFVATYCIYPKYLNTTIFNEKKEINMVGMLAVIGRINSERIEITNTLIKEEKLNTNIPMIKLANALHTKDVSILKGEHLGELYSKRTDYFNSILSLILISLAKNNKVRESVLNNIRVFLSVEVFNNILLITQQFYPGNYLILQWNWLLSEQSEFQEARNNILDNINSVYEFKDNKNISKDFNDNLFAISMSGKKFDDAKEALSLLIMSGDFILLDVIKKGIAISNITFDFYSAQLLADLLVNLDVYYANRVGILERFRSAIHFEKDLYNLTSLSFDIATYKPDKIFYTNFLLSNLNDKKTENDIKNALTTSLRLDNNITIRKVNGYIAAEIFEEAEKLACKLVIANKYQEGYVVVYSQALSYNNKLKNAVNLIEKYIEVNGISKQIATEAMRLYVLDSQYSKSLTILNKCISKNVDIGEMHKRKAYFGNRLVGKAFETFKELNIALLMKNYFPNKYFNDMRLLKDKKKVLFISIFGPGDEIRFASIYNSLRDNLSNSEIIISCSPRLKNIFLNSFPGLDFVAVDRPRNDDKIIVSNYSQVPGSDLVGIIDDSAMGIIESVDAMSLITSMLYDVLPDYKSFSGEKYLSYDIDLKNMFMRRLSAISSKILIGISWRSSITTSARNEHYLSIAELECLFKIPEIQFVNFQYDECEEEVNWINQRYPGKLLNFNDIDQYNDFDSVAALMSCMDLILAPATTVAELAGALGVKTWLFSNSSEIDWRKVSESATDVWHKSVTIVDVPEKGNKNLLINEIKQRLEGFVHENIK